MWGLFGCCQLPNLLVGWGRWHKNLPLEYGEINLLPPQSGQVSFRIQERQSAQRMKELTLQMEVDALVCCVVDGTCSRSEYADAHCYSKLINVDEAGDGVQLLSVWWLESE